MGAMGFLETLAKGPTPKQRSPKAGWYSKPGELGKVRYWDGHAWTEWAAPAVAAEEIGIYTGEPPVPYWEVGRFGVKVGSSLVTKGPTIEDANMKLRERASKFGATAVIQVTYGRGPTATSVKGLYANGMAVVLKEQPTAATATLPPPSMDVGERLTKLDELRDSKAITEAEYAAQRQRILSEL